MMSSKMARKGRSLEASPSPPNKHGSEPSGSKPKDPNMSNPRLLVNRACIYERRLPGDAYITAHVQRLQHGYYSSPAVSDKDAEHVDFLAISFVFHSAHTLSHRFKSATIRATIQGAREVSSSAIHPNGYPPGNPRFLMHAPHLIYGTVSPETMEWTFSLAGSLGISETPVSASVIPSGSINGRYRRYEMMRIQGSARTRKSSRGPEFDVEAGEILWSLEENNLQRSGLPREFTFVMLIQKPAANSKLKLALEIEPILQTWYGSYPNWLLALSPYQPLERRGVDFSREVGQRFEPTDGERGYNWAALESSFDDYIAMPGRKFTRQMQIPQDDGLPDNHIRRSYPGEYGSLNPNPNLNPIQQLQSNGLSIQNNSLSLQNNLLHSHLRQLQQGSQTQGAAPPSASAAPAMATAATPIGGDGGGNTLNVRLFVDQVAASHLSRESARSISISTGTGTGIQSGADEHDHDHDHERERDAEKEKEKENADGGHDLRRVALANHWVDDETRARVLRGKVYGEDSSDEKSASWTRRGERPGRGRVMMLANVPLTQSLVSALSQMPR